MTASVPLAILNTADEKAFLAALSDIYEHAPWVAQFVLDKRPFASLSDLHAAMMAAVRAASSEQRSRLIRGHPDLAGKAARAGTMTDASKAEQAGAGLDRLSEEEFARFHQLNDAYRLKFGMPFIICVRRHGKGSILRSFERRLQHSPAAEQEAALMEIFRIAALRLDQRVESSDRLPVHGNLSTHVLDTHRGQPASGIKIELVELVSEAEQLVLKAGVTNRDGRTEEPLISGRPLPIGRYELRFHVADYFAASDVRLSDPPFFDIVPVRFALAEPEGHYHVPLLLTPWSYTSYRGS
ncbi:MAG TPA: 2-oxo-4-hydroxy-4-carboxy-5-ureidoimidazoline decarboxylase [Xanthobacteraceae bacterium]